MFGLKKKSNEVMVVGQKKKKNLFKRAYVAMMASSLIVGTFNTSLTINIQKMNNEIEVLKGENEKLNIEISSLQNKDRVYVIAQAADMNQNQANIVSVVGD